MRFTIKHIADLFFQHGARMYSGEPVTQLEHALQTAWLAEQAGADDELTTASLLHDLGHMLSDQGETPTLRGIDDTHQYFALPFLRGLFSDRLLDTIKLHVNAKRYLCATQTDYSSHLSEDSRRSLILQGGVYTQPQCDAFMAQPAARDAIKLRQWDDQAKHANLSTPALVHFLASAERCSIAS